MLAFSYVIHVLIVRTLPYSVLGISLIGTIQRPSKSLSIGSAPALAAAIFYI